MNAAIRECATKMTSHNRFFTRLKQMPAEIQTRIWADYYRLAAEEHGEQFIEIHDELTDYRLCVIIGKRIKLTLCRANKYYSIVDIEDLWLNPYIYKYAVEAQVKCDCLRILDAYKECRVNQPTVRFGNVIVELGNEYKDPGLLLKYYLDKIPGARDYAEDIATYSRRWRSQIEWLSYNHWNTDYINVSGISMNGLGVSGRGPEGFDSGTNLGTPDNSGATDDSESDSSSSSSFSDNEDGSSTAAEDASADDTSDEEETWFGSGTG